MDFLTYLLQRLRGFGYGVESVGSVTIESLVCLSINLATYVHIVYLCIVYVVTYVHSRGHLPDRSD